MKGASAILLRALLMTFLTSGATSDIYLSENNRLIKLFKQQFSYQFVKHEADIQQAVFEKGILVPHIYEVYQINGCFAIAMEYVHGTTFGKIIFSTDNYTARLNIDPDLMHKFDGIIKYLNTMIDVQIQVNEVAIDNQEAQQLGALFPPMKEYLKKQIESVDCLEEKSKAKFIQALDGVVFRQNLCHGDIHPFNLIETPKGIVIIDWANATAGNSEADVCRSYLIYKLYLPEMAEKFLDLYCNRTQTPRDSILYFEPIAAAARLAENRPDYEVERIFRILSRYT
jgi:tRNA A-37 threonylcarbamoyl transferase component Bud32